MKTFLKFIGSLIALLFLVPWNLSERIFLFFFRPILYRKYNPGFDQRKMAPARVLFVIALFLVLGYVVFVGYEYIRMQNSMTSALANVKDMFYIMYNHAAVLVNAFLWPVNVMYFYAQGGDMPLRKLLLAYYLLFLPIIFVANLVYNYFATTRLLHKAVHLRDAADQEIQIVNYSEKAGDGEIFFGLDLLQQGKPFYVKKKWLQGHLQVIGSPGSGKTESIIQPLWFQNVRVNTPTVVLDGKGTQSNIDQFYTIASSLAQGHEIIYFNPADPDRSAMYNPLLRGTVEEIKQRILTSLNWAYYTATSRERLDFYLSTILRTIKETNPFINLYEILKYFESKNYIVQQLNKIRSGHLRGSLEDLLANFNTFQKETIFFSALLWDICQSDYAWLLETNEPELDFVDAYLNKEDCYITLPITNRNSAMAFLGQLTIADLLGAYHHLHTRGSQDTNGRAAGEGLLVIDELIKFANPQLVDLLRAARNLGVAVCYTNQTPMELENPELGLPRGFLDQLADQTNMVACFNLSSDESIQRVVNRFGIDPAAVDAAAGAANGDAAAPQKTIQIDANLVKNLDVGQCVMYVRHPRTIAYLKTGYFHFKELMPYIRPESEEPVSD